MRRVVLLLVLALFAAGPVLAQEEAKTERLEDLIPENTFFFASLNDISSMRTQCARSAMGKLWKEPELQQFLAPLMSMAKAQLKQAESQLGHPVLKILDSLSGQAAIAVVKYDPMYGGKVPDLAIMVDLGEGRADFQKAHAAMIQEKGQNVGYARKDHKGVAIDIYSMPGGVQLSVAYFGNSLVLSTMTERLREMIDRSQAGTASTLGASEAFKAVRKNTGRDAFFTAYFNMEAVFNHFSDRMPPQASSAMSKLAITDVKGLGFGSTIAGEGLRETFFAYAPGEKRGLVKLFYNMQGDGTALLKNIPKGAFWAEAGRANWQNIYSDVLKLIGDVEPMALEQVMNQIYQFEEFMGFRIKEDFLAPLGDEMAAYAAMPAGGGLIPDIVLMVKMKDAKRFHQTLGQIVEKGQAIMAQQGQYQMSLRNLTFAEKKIHYINVAEKWGEPFPVTPSWVLNGDVAYFSLYPQVLKDLAARNFSGASILDRADFARARKGLPEGMSSIEYVDFSQLIRIGYGTLAPILQAAAKNAEMPVDMAYLPRTETIAKHFFGGVWGMKLEDEGMAMHAYTPCGVMPMVLVSMAPLLILGRATSSEMVYREAVPETRAGDGSIGIGPAPAPKPKPAPKRPMGSATDRLEEVYVALLWHYADKGAFPETLAALVKTKALESSLSLIMPGETATEDSGARTSLDFVGPNVGDLTEGRDRAVWVYSREPVNGKRWVLFANGDRRQVAEADFQKLLAATKGMLTK